MTADSEMFHHHMEALIADCHILGTEIQRFPLIAPISTNSLFATVNGKRVKTKSYKAWRSEQTLEFIACRERRRRIKSAAVILRPNGQTIDTDNTAKAYLDAMVEVGVLADDNAITCNIVYPTTEGVGYALVIPE